MNFFKNALVSLFIMLGAVGLETKEAFAQVPTDLLNRMEIAFEGDYSRSQIQQRVDEAMTLYKVPKTDDYYSRVGSVLIVLRKETGQQEMVILDYMISSFTSGVEISFPEAAGLAAAFLQTEDSEKNN